MARLEDFEHHQELSHEDMERIQSGASNGSPVGREGPSHHEHLSVDNSDYNE